MPRLKGQIDAPDQPLGDPLKFGTYIIYGAEEAAEFMRCSPSTVRKWARLHGFPLVKLPNGTLATTTSLIDTWLLARYRAWRETYHQQKA